MGLPALQTYTDNIHSLSIEDFEDAYSSHFQTFLRWREERGLTDTLNAIREYFEDLNKTRYAAKTKLIKRSAVLNRLRRAADTMPPAQRYSLETFINRLQKDPQTKAPKVQQSGVSVSKVITEAEHKKLLKNARSDRQRAFMLFLWETGCRVNELTGAELHRCQSQGQYWTLTVTGKGDKERQVYLSNETFQTIRDLFQGSFYLFETSNGKRYNNAYISNQLRKITLAVLGRALSAHCWRHSAATRLLDRTGKIQEVSRFLGHSSPSITLSMYIHQNLTPAEVLQ